MYVTKAAIFMILWVLAHLMPGPALAQIGSVQMVKTAAWGTPPEKVRQVLVVPAAVVANERVETAVQGGLHLRFLDDTEFRLGSGSSAVLDQFIYNPSTKTGVFVSSMIKGAFRVITGKMNKTGFRLFTPVAVIGVRGTDFVVTVGQAGLTTVSVLSGSVTITPLGGSPMSVAAGQAAVVAAVASPAQSVAPPAATDPARSSVAGEAAAESFDKAKPPFGSARPSAATDSATTVAAAAGVAARLKQTSILYNVSGGQMVLVLTGDELAKALQAMKAKSTRYDDHTDIWDYTIAVTVFRHDDTVTVIPKISK